MRCSTSTHRPQDRLSEKESRMVVGCQGLLNIGLRISQNCFSYLTVSGFLVMTHTIIVVDMEMVSETYPFTQICSGEGRYQKS